ncbi:MAG: hypothetical protein IPI35_29885 [Deltaproteobacteria bacterium]|nr:hypothetical protein [Deltaproteobacteria bacterium]
MPSILELLQRGFERLPGKPDFRVVLTDGLPAHVLSSRLVALSYQHRMHPDISRFPREQFYAAPDGLNGAERVRSTYGWLDDSEEYDDPEGTELLRDAATMKADQSLGAIHAAQVAGRGWVHVARSAARRVATGPSLRRAG